MEKRIELEKRGRDSSEITELSLDNCRSPNIAGLTEEFVNLEKLSLLNVGLTSLKGFPKLPNLKKLDLSKNRFSNGLQVLQSSPKLSELNLSDNKINDLESLEPLKELKNLKSLYLSDNDIANTENYREDVFGMLAQLKYLDGFDAEDHSDASDNEAAGVVQNGNGEEASADDEDNEAGDDEEVDDEDEDDDEDDESDEDNSLELRAVYDNLDNESEGDDYEGEGEEGEDDDDEDIGDDEEEEEGEDDDANEESVVRGKKRKHEEELEGE